MESILESIDTEFKLSDQKKFQYFKINRESSTKIWDKLKIFETTTFEIPMSKEQSFTSEFKNVDIKFVVIYGMIALALLPLIFLMYIFVVKRKRRGYQKIPSI